MTEQTGAPPPPPRRGRLILWTIAGLTVLGVAAGVFARFVWLARELDTAEAALRRNDPAAARIRLEKYLAHRPTDQRALLLAAEAARRSEAFADAERYVTALEKKTGPTPQSRLEWVLLGAQQGDFAPDEERLHSEVVNNNPDSPLILEALAKGYRAAYRFSDANLMLNRLLELNPDHVPALVLRGNINEGLRRFEPATADFQRALKLAPDNPTVLSAVAGYRSRRGYTHEAIAEFEQALRAQPGDATILLGLARAAFDTADLTEAERRLDDLLANHPGHVEALVERGRAALRRNQPAVAEPFLAQAVQRAPWNRDAQQLQRLALKDLGRTEALSQAEGRLAALDAEESLLGRLLPKARGDARNTAVRWELWLWSVRNGQHEEGVAWLTEILRADPRHGPTHTALAEHFEKIGQPRRAALHRAIVSES